MIESLFNEVLRKLTNQSDTDEIENVVDKKRVSNVTKKIMYLYSVVRYEH